VQLRHLETFVTIVEAGTLTAAADRLYKTQGAVSHDLRALESELGFAVIDRSGQRIKVTEGGLALLPQAQEILKRMQDLTEESKRIRRGDGIAMRLGVLPSLARVTLPLLEVLFGARANAGIVYVPDGPETLRDELLAGRLDLAICEPVYHDAVLVTTLAEEEVVVVLPAGHALASRSALSAVDVADLPLIGFPTDRGSGRTPSRFFAEAGHHPMPRVATRDTSVMLDLIASGAGFGLLPRSCAAIDDRVALVPSSPALRRTVCIARGRDRLLPAHVDEAMTVLATRWSTTDNPHFTPAPPVDDRPPLAAAG
jgi:DNA-binding transcriptional LysR family regulator